MHNVNVRAWNGRPIRASACNSPEHVAAACESFAVAVQPVSPQSRSAGRRVSSRACRAQRIPWQRDPVQGFGAPGGEIVTRPCTPRDAYSVADVHVAAFYPRSPLRWFLRMDRVLALKVGEEEQAKPNNGSFICFVADIRPDWEADSLAQDAANMRRMPPRLFRSVHTALSKRGDSLKTQIVQLFFDMLQWPEAAYACVPYSERGIVGAVVYDTLGYHVGGKWAVTPSGIKFVRSHNIGYISNLAVAQGARRQGIGTRLVRRCEEMARADPTVKAMALHVEKSNKPAIALYRSMGYQPVTDPARWQRLISVNQAENGAGLQLMLKDVR